MATTRDVIDNHLEAFFTHDLQGVLRDYADDIVFFTSDGPLRGKEEVRTLFDGLIREFKQPGTRFSVTQYLVEGPHGYLVWNAETAENTYALGTDTFVVRDGRIVAQSFAASVHPKR